MKSNILSLIILFSIGFISVSCNDDAEVRPEFTLEIPDEIDDEEYKIYSLLILYASNNIIILQESSKVNSNSVKEDVDEIRNYNPGLDAEIETNFYLKNSEPSYFDNKFTYLNGDVTLISSDESDYIFNGSIDISKMWSEFQKYYEDASEVNYFSRVGFNESKTKALLVSGSFYGLDYNKDNLFNFGGHHSLIYLEKEDTNWVIMEPSITTIGN